VIRRLSPAVLVLWALGVLPHVVFAAPATVPFTSCEPTPVLCAVVTVPMDRSGATPGTFDLAVRRKPATSGSATGTIVALTGGPGGAAIPALASFAERLSAVHATRDLVVFDVRGVGLSSPVSCGLPSLATFDAVRRCADALGPVRAFFHSRDTADDLESVRIAVGADRIALSAVSYGAVAAYDYAVRYPSHVEMIILDSPVAPGGWDPTMQERVALPRVLKSLCAGGLCRGSMRPARDLGVLLPRLRRKPLVAPLVLPTGRVVPSDVIPSVLYSALVSESDVNPSLRALIPAALHAAVAGDGAPLARVVALTYGRGAAVAGSAAAGESLNSAVNHATNCEETRFPWPRDAPPRTAAWKGDPGDAEPRAAAMTAAVHAAPASRYAPFTGLEVVASRESVARSCIAWPQTLRPPDALGTAPPPDVPALILAGEHDLRTPLESSRAIAARFPHGQVVTARYTGHGVLGGAPRAVRPCVTAAVERFVAGAPAQATCSGATRLPPVPPAPTALGGVSPPTGVPGDRGRTLQAVLLTLNDVKYSWAAAASRLATTSGSVAVGGLRGGRVRGSLHRLKLSGVVYVPGVVVNGTFDAGAATARIAVTGRGSRGAVRLTPTRATGSLDGRAFSVPRPAIPTPLI